MHPSYYYRAHACILVFDVTRKITYQHLSNWLSELRRYCENIPCILVANKIDVDYSVCGNTASSTCPCVLRTLSACPVFVLLRQQVTCKSFKFAQTHNLPFFFVSAADGTNAVKVFEEAIKEAVAYKKSGNDFMTEVLEYLG